MIFTTYAGNLNNIPEKLKKVAITRFTPKWMEPYIDEINIGLSPSKQLLVDYKNGVTCKEDYVKQFNSYLETYIQPNKLIDSLQDCVLICTCKTGKFCHRHLITEFLRKNGAVIEELDIDNKLKDIDIRIEEDITVDSCYKNYKDIYVYEDNYNRDIIEKSEGIATAPNTFAIRTKMVNDELSTLNTSSKLIDVIISDLEDLLTKAYSGNTIVFPSKGLGDNLKRYNSEAYRIMTEYINTKFLFKIKKDFNNKIVIAGSRGFMDYDLLKDTMDKYIKSNLIRNPIIISGGARGADKLGEQYANERGYPLEIYKADWEKYGKKAGFMRNHEMAKIANDAVLFWDGKSKGTEGMFITCKRLRYVKVKMVKYI